MHALRSVALMALMVAAPLAALAHAKMVASMPQDGATVAAGLSQIELKFSHAMRLTLVRVHRADDDKDVGLQGALPKTFTQAAKVSIDALMAGAYDVSWTAVSEDGHVMKGSFSFSVAATPAQ
jgi:hypothetical protein